MKLWRRVIVFLVVGGLMVGGIALLGMAQKNMTLSVACEADQFANYLKVMAKQFKEETGIEVKVDILGYSEHRQKITQDYTTNTIQYDLATVDTVWTGEFEEKEWTVDLTPFIKRDYLEINVPDIMPVGFEIFTWKDKLIAFPMSGYSLSLVYRKDLLDDPKEKAAFKEKYGYELQFPKTMEQMADVATFFTRPKEDFYGLVAGGARGVCCAQEFMTYLKCFNARIFDEKGNVTLDSPEGLAALKFFVRIFDEWAPPGAAAYWWDGRETAYRMGKTLMQITWSISRPGYELPDFSKIIGKTAMAAHPSIPGVKTSYGYGGWGIGINADISEDRQEAAWGFIKFITSPENQKAWMLTSWQEYGSPGDTGMPIRLSTLIDPELNEKNPWLKDTMLIEFIYGDFSFRPPVPEYAQIESILGLYANMAIAHELTPEEALTKATSEIKAIYEK